MYYFDKVTATIVEEMDPTVPPERYCEYRRGYGDDCISEFYIVSHDPLNVKEFFYDITYERCPNRLAMCRKDFFAEHNISDPVMYAYQDIQSRYDETIDSYKNGQLSIEDDADELEIYDEDTVFVYNDNDLHKKYTTIMQEILKVNGDDKEYEHVDADGALCHLLIELGFKDVVDIYLKINKWFA